VLRPPRREVVCFFGTDSDAARPDSTDRTPAQKGTDMTERLTGAEALIRALEYENVELIFGYPG
jgi:hypothetical protein